MRVAVAEPVEDRARASARRGGSRSSTPGRWPNVTMNLIFRVACGRRHQRARLRPPVGPGRVAVRLGVGDEAHGAGVEPAPVLAAAAASRAPRATRARAGSRTGPCSCAGRRLDSSHSWLPHAGMYAAELAPGHHVVEVPVDGRLTVVVPVRQVAGDEDERRLVARDLRLRRADARRSSTESPTSASTSKRKVPRRGGREGVVALRRRSSSGTSCRAIRPCQARLPERPARRERERRRRVRGRRLAVAARVRPYRIVSAGADPVERHRRRAREGVVDLRVPADAFAAEGPPAEAKKIVTVTATVTAPTARRRSRSPEPHPPHSSARRECPHGRRSSRLPRWTRAGATRHSNPSSSAAAASTSVPGSKSS